MILISNNFDEKSLIDSSFYELSSFYDVVSQFSYGAGLIDVKIKDLLNMLRCPDKYRDSLIKLSKYFYNKDGIVTDIYDLFKVLPILNYSIAWNEIDKDGYKKNKKTIDTFVKRINVKQLARDTIFSVIEEGTCVWYNRKNKYIQFLDLNDICIKYMKNGKWQVLFDMKSLEKYKLGTGLEDQIKSAPDEITISTYNKYKKDPSKYRFIELDINKTQVFKLRGSRNEPFGLPYAIPALASIIHRDLLERTEKALADRIINQIIIQKIGTIPHSDGKSQLPVSKDATQGYHDNLKNLLQCRYDPGSDENASSAPLTVPSFIDIEELKINMNTFPKEIWERIDRDIYKKLGYSAALNSGGGNGQSFGSSTINVEKIFSIIFYLIEQIETALNEYFENIVTNSAFEPRIRFSRNTILDKELQFKMAESLFTKARGSYKHLAEAAGYDFDHWLAQVEYEANTLRIDERIPVHSTSYTVSGGESGRPSNPSSGNENTDKSRGNNGNATPSPGD